MDVVQKYKVRIEKTLAPPLTWVTLIRYHNQLASRAVVGENGGLTWIGFDAGEAILPTFVLEGEEQLVIEELLNTEEHKQQMIDKEAECLGRIAEIQAKLDETTTQSERLSDRLLGIIETLSQPAPPPVVAPAATCNYDRYD